MSESKNKGQRVDLSDLVERARGEVKTLQPLGSDRKERPAWVAKAAAAAATAAVAGAIYVVSPWILGFGDSALQAGLATVAEEARKDVEAYRSSKGKLPDALPNVALAMAVEYYRESDGYRLRATDGTRVVEMDPKGQVTASRSR